MSELIDDRITEFCNILGKHEFTIPTEDLADVKRKQSIIKKTDGDSKKRHEDGLKRILQGFGKAWRDEIALLEKLAKHEIDELLLNRSANSVAKSDIPSFRKGISKRFPNHPILACFRFNGTEHTKMNTDYHTDVTARQAKRKDLKAVNRYIEHAKNLLNENDSSWLSLACGLLALTGRRPIEIMARGSFLKSSRNTVDAGGVLVSVENPVNFDGQAKAREAREDFVIPLLGSCDVAMINDAVDKLRKLKEFDLEGLDNEDANKRIHDLVGKSISRRVKKEFAKFGLKTGKDCRAAYAEIVNALYCSTDLTVEQQNIFLQNILGHGDKISSHSYRIFNIVSWD